VRDFLIAVGSVAGIFACFLLWRFAKIMDRIERDVDNIRAVHGLPARNREHFYPNEDDLRDQEIMKRA
jgi:hypothetical protein